MCYATLKQKQEQRRLYLLQAIRSIGNPKELTDIALPLRLKTVKLFIDRYWDDSSYNERFEIKNIHLALEQELQKRICDYGKLSTDTHANLAR